MEELLNFAKGPLFRFSFAIMILGLLRVFGLSLINGFEAKKKAQDKSIPKGYVRKMTFGFLFPVRAFRVKPFYAFVSILFHIGLIFTPIFLFDHALLFQNSIGISWLNLTLSKQFADWMTIITIATGILLFLIRISSKTSRFISRKQDYLWPLLLLIPFISGLVCAQLTVNPDVYNAFILIHILSGCLIFILMPFTKIAHCILLPLSQWITARAWKFPPEAGENVMIDLGKEGEAL
ncbi:MAG: hypothetical protein A2X61_16945 [Ignavibacteria bacterium GWB2_35_12]|nr:MAG: hypothetical protein A2X63_01950 [Ignavibacteria bacterium GWA2_35_8]OGU38038.1 MAG: hypothetical protein A2X61_16945 [Ignavibacteria bacterium GWB2_35_12]OGU87494.1 MAG: hypothetical protein A2220_17080 [Ignavibacteria bacterium RIFOXYA2_FULL_35_10]OGV25040.1 MAG: hypothetical protein A2475_16680 [Ignavibacteria bacterium RIFOXYC2_FULL_35_21]